MKTFEISYWTEDGNHKTSRYMADNRLAALHKFFEDHPEVDEDEVSCR